MAKQYFDSFLNERCPSELQTNNSPEGFEGWLEQLDTSEVMDLAEKYGEVMYWKGQLDLANELQPMVNNLAVGCEAANRSYNEHKNE